MYFNLLMEQVLGKFVEDADRAKGNMAGDEMEDEGDPNPASAQAPKVGATKDIDFISNKGGGAMNPRFAGNQNEYARSNDSMVRKHVIYYVVHVYC